MDLVQLHSLLKTWDFYFVMWLRGTLLVKNSIMVFFIYLAHFQIDISQGAYSGRFDGKRFFFTKVLIYNFVHPWIKVCIVSVVSMIILEMNN